MRHDPDSDGADRNKADREYQLIQQHETAAVLRPREFADVSGRDRHLAAESDALDGAEPDQRVVVPGEGADEAHDGEHSDRADHRRHAAIALTNPAEQ